MSLVRLVLVLCLAGLTACSRPEPLPNYGQLPDFELVDQFGATRTLDSLAQHVWIADFVFTRCAGPCPRMSRHMARVQESLADEPAVRFVSISVDPDYDTPERLAEYARRFGANTATWWFLTGDKMDIYTLIKDGFLLGVDDGLLQPDGTPGEGIITHSTRFAVVDQMGRVRAYFDGNDETDGAELRAAIRKAVESVLAEQG